jgi:SAM-dependent methyltransferase
MTNPTAQSGTWEEAVEWLRRQPSQRSMVRAAYYDDPLLDAAERYWRSEEWAGVRTWIPAAGLALDAGAGRGIASFALAREGLRVVAVEPDRSSVVGARAIRNLAEEACLDVGVTRAVLEKLPFKDQTFNLVFARAVLHHARDLDAACNEFYRVLRPGGVLVAIREHVISRDEDLPAFFDVHPLHRIYGGENAFRLERYKDAIRGAGFGLEALIGPLESPINFAPHTIGSLQAELARRLVGSRPKLESLLHRMLRARGVWPVLKNVLATFDQRPGRLYSFIARRP